MKKTLNYLIIPILAAPFVYLSAVWNRIAETIPMHYNIDGEADRYGNKSELLILVLIMGGMAIGIYLLLINLYRIDPKRKNNPAATAAQMKPVAFLTASFLSALACFFIHTALRNTAALQANIILVLMGLFFSLLGNYMPSLKPNYFAGFRIPWTLENETNWRKTHKLAGRLWFAGGMCIMLGAFFFSNQTALYTMFAVMAVITIIPIVYSYRLFKTGDPGS